MSDLETSIKFAVFKHLGGDCVNDMCTFSTDCACHEESKSLGSQIYDEVAPPLSVTQKIVNWILMLNAIACAWIVYSEPGSVHLKILATLGVLAPFCQIVYELLTGRKTPYAEDRIVYAMFTAFMFLLAAGGGFVHHLLTERPLLTFSERWPDSDAIIKWRLHEDYLAEKKGRSI